MMQQMLLGLGPSGINIDDVFSVDTYTGNGGTSLSINNGIDLSGEGGLVWIKTRSANSDHYAFDTERGSNKSILPNDTASQSTHLSNDGLTSFNSNGFTVGGVPPAVNYTQNYVAWTFRKAPEFFDIVTYTGNGTAGRTISHNLGAVPGAIWVKVLSAGDSWGCYHTSMGNTKALWLNDYTPGTTNGAPWNNTSPTSSVFTVGSDNQFNGSGRTYVAYLFAEDTDNLIKCGSYTGNGSASQTITTGFDVQWLITKPDTTYGDWVIWDTTRGMTTSSSSRLYANRNYDEDTGSNGAATTTNGFIADNYYNVSGRSYTYIAIAAP